MCRSFTAAVAVVVCGLLAGACGPSDGSPDNEVVVLAASSLTGAFTEIGDAFEAANPGAEVTFSFAGSSELVAQLLEGAPGDVIATADRVTMHRLTEAGGTVAEPVVFATNRAAIVVAEGNPLGIADVRDLVDPDLVLVSCAPEVPCGRYARQVFESAGIDPTPSSLEPSVGAVVTKVRLGEADAGIVYATDVVASDDEVDGVAVPDDLNVVAEYPIAVAASAPDGEVAARFVAFVAGSEGQAVLAEFGFTAP